MSNKDPQKHIIHIAIRWKKMLDTGKVRSFSEIAKNEGLSRARVTQIMNLLKLPAHFQKFLAELTDPKQVRYYSERRIRGWYSKGEFPSLPFKSREIKRSTQGCTSPKRKRGRGWRPPPVCVVRYHPMPPENLEALVGIVKKVALRMLREMQEKEMEKNAT